MATENYKSEKSSDQPTTKSNRLDLQAASAIGHGLSKRQSIVQYLYQCYASQRTYARTPDQIRMAIEVFCKHLEPIDIVDIETAFNEHISSSPEMPTPSCIISLARASKKRREIATAVNKEAIIQAREASIVENRSNRALLTTGDATNE